MIARQLGSADASSALGAALGQCLTSGDIVLMSGPLGAGKSHVSRAMIRAWMGDPDLNVPSPTYTLVNVYTRPGDGAEIWHADLYRLGGSDEMEELGIDDALSHAVVIVEWPERWATLPPRHLALALEITGDESRALTLRATGPGWDNALAAVDAAA